MFSNKYKNSCKNGFENVNIIVNLKMEFSFMEKVKNFF